MGVEAVAAQVHERHRVRPVGHGQSPIGRVVAQFLGGFLPEVALHDADSSVGSAQIEPTAATGFGLDGLKPRLPGLGSPGSVGVVVGLRQSDLGRRREGDGSILAADETGQGARLQGQGQAQSQASQEGGARIGVQELDRVGDFQEGSAGPGFEPQDDAGRFAGLRHGLEPHHGAQAALLDRERGHRDRAGVGAAGGMRGASAVAGGVRPQEIDEGLGLAVGAQHVASPQADPAQPFGSGRDLDL